MFPAAHYRVYTKNDDYTASLWGLQTYMERQIHVNVL